MEFSGKEKIMKRHIMKSIAIILIINIIIIQLSFIFSNKTYAGFDSIRCESPSRPVSTPSSNANRSDLVVSSQVNQLKNLILHQAQKYQMNRLQPHIFHIYQEMYIMSFWKKNQ